MANQQSQSNIQTAVANSFLNATNQYTPFGSVEWRQVGERKLGDGSVTSPIWQVHQTLSPEQQKLYDAQTGLSQGALDLGQGYLKQIGQATAQPFNYEGLPNAPTYDEAYRRQQLANIQARAQPMMDRQRAQLEQQLADRGVGMQDPAYRTAMDQYQRGLTDFQLAADLQAGQEATNAYNLAGQTRDRAINERAALRAQPINEFSQMLGFGGSGVRQPSYMNLPQNQVAPTDVVGAYNTAYQQQAQQQQMANQQNNAMMGGLFGLGSAGISAYGMMNAGSLAGGAAML